MTNCKDFEFDKALKIFHQDKSSLYFYDIDDGYEIVLICDKIHKDNTVEKTLYIKENEDIICLYKSQNNTFYMYKSLDSAYRDIENEDIFFVTIKLGAYKSNITNKYIPKRIVDKAYELMTLMSNGEEFEVISKEEAIVGFNHGQSI